jgi:hypothetical protein
MGIFGATGNSASYAGFFNGRVGVNGPFNAVTKNAVVPFPDGSQRLLHCMESPDHWFEDFGSAKLVRGRAVVKLDANFAKVIKRGDYRAFVTPEDDCRGLYVRRKSANGSQFVNSWAASRASPFPAASWDAARTSRRTGASPRSTFLRRCQLLGRHAHCVGLCRRRDCVRSSLAWRRRRPSGHPKAQRKAEHATSAEKK